MPEMIRYGKVRMVMKQLNIHSADVFLSREFQEKLDNHGLDT